MDQEGAPKRRRPAGHHNEEFKGSVVEHWRSSGKTAAAVAREFGISVWNLRDWQQRYAPAPKGVDDPVPESPQEMKREIQQLREELARTIHQLEILKKLWALFRKCRGPLPNDPGTFQKGVGGTAV